MVRPLRDTDPSKYNLVTIRTDSAELWMIPSRALNRMIGGIVARYQEATGVEIYAYCVLSNHLHMVIRAPQGELDVFFENVNREIARRVNRSYGRIANFWARRYDAQVILNQDDLLEAFLYVTTNAVRHGLARKSAKWPGLCSIHQSVEQRQQRYHFTHYSLRDESDNFVRTEHKLTLSRLPMFDNLDRAGYLQQVRLLVRARERLILEQRQEMGQGFLEPSQVLAQIPGSVSKNTSRSRRPICYTKCSQTRKRYRRERKWFRELYYAASRKFRAGELSTVFPHWCFKPPLHRIPIERPRKVFDDKYQYSNNKKLYQNHACK